MTDYISMAQGGLYGCVYVCVCMSVIYKTCIVLCPVPNHMHCAKSVLYNTVYYSVYSNIRKKYKHLLIEPYKQERILQYSQSRVVCGILANL